MPDVLIDHEATLDLIVESVVDVVIEQSEPAETIVTEAEQGPPGPPGPPGPAGGSTYQHHQDIALAVWTIAHNLNRYPAITTTDTLGRVVVADVEYLDTNIVRITHGVPITGHAFIN